MVTASAAQVLVDFASQIDLSGHCYIAKTDGRFTLSDKKSDTSHLVELIKEARKDATSAQEVSKAVSVIKGHLEKKISGLFSLFIGEKDKTRIRNLILNLGDGNVGAAPATEGEARIQFYQELPSMLRVRSAAGKDLETIKIVSKKLWDHFGDYAEYKKHMKLFFEGEHFLFEEEGNEYSLYDELKDPTKTDAYLRGSSHYDHGTTNNKTGGPVPEKASDVANAQYEIEGPQLKALLFGRVELAVDDKNRLIFGKTFKDVSGTKRDTPRKFTFLQTEWAPDSSSLFSLNFWKHRVFSFILYAARKTIGSETPNVGPYGFGHGDAKNPTVIPLKKET